MVELLITASAAVNLGTRISFLRRTLLQRPFLRRPFLGSFCFVIFLCEFTLMASAQAPAAPGKPLPPGPMQAKVKASCTTCHNTSRITEQHMTRQQWSTELEKMEGLGAVIPDTDRDAFLKYLAKNFGPAKGASASTKKSRD
jgi:hypothetical protein